MNKLAELKPNNDMAYIVREVKKLFLLHGLPPEIARMKHIIDFNCAMCLRKICQGVREEHWEYISEEKV